MYPISPILHLNDRRNLILIAMNRKARLRARNPLGSEREAAIEKINEVLRLAGKAELNAYLASGGIR